MSKILTIISSVIFLVVGISITFASILPSGLSAKLWPILLVIFGLLIIFWQIFWHSLWRGDKFLGKSENEWRDWGEDLARQFKVEDKN